jgi:YhcN/YlaJ family sporulation lipoprotein
LKISKQILLMFIILLIGGCLVAGGCAKTSNKPMPAPTAPAPSTPTPAPTPTPTPTPTPNVTTPTPTYPTDVSNRVAMEAGKVAGVDKATAIVSGKMIYIGLDLKANLDKTKSAAAEKNVMDQVKNIEPGYTVIVTSDVDTVTRIKNVAQGIAQGQPLSSFTNEIANIGTRLTPKIK